MAESDIFVSNDVEMDVNFGEVFVIDQGVVYKIVASKYNNTATYVVGAYVLHLEKLYRCITAIEEPEEFDAEKWTQVLLANEVQIANANIALKANADDVYDKTTIDGKVSGINAAIALKANSADVYAKTETYNQTEVDDALATKADADMTYSKTEVDDALALKADAATTYNKTEVDNALATKADAATTYTKTEVDTALSTKADSSSVYSKSDTDTLLAAKADVATTYTKTEVDNALANKANSADVYAKTETYSKTEVDTNIYKKTETYSKTEVDGLINNLPAPMVMKGTLGTDGTITDLPTASSENEGFTYKVITDGTYAGQAAKTGDLFTSAKPVGSSDYIWLYIPSGDETFADTWRGIKVNGIEKLGSSINTGSVDFKNGINSTVVFDSSDSSIKVDVDGYTQAQVDTKLSAKANSADVYAKSETYSASEVDTKLLAKANSSDVYTQAEVDTKLSGKANTSDVYTQAQIDTKLADKANASDVYAKNETYSQAEVDSKLLAKANSSDVYTKQETYTKTEVNTALSEKADTSTVTTALALKADKADTYTKEEVDDKFDEIDPIGTASGAIASFETNLAAPLNSLKCEINAKQDLHGEDKPYPAGGGKNKLPLNDGTYSLNTVTVTINNGKVTVSGTATSSGGRLVHMSDVFTLKAGTYYIKGNTALSGLTPFLNRNSDNTPLNNGDNESFTLSQDTDVFFGFNIINGYTYNGTALPMVNLGSSALPWEPYSNICPINGYTEANITRCGKNLLNPSDFVRGLLNYEDGSLNTGVKSWITSAFTNAIGTVTIQGYKDGIEDNFCVRFCEYDANKAFIKSTNNINISSSASFSRTITLDNDTRFIRTTVGFDNKTTTIEGYFATNRIMLVIGNSTAYEPYNDDTFTVSFGQTVYGGVYDANAGKVTCTDKYKNTFVRGSIDSSGKLYYVGEASDGKSYGSQEVADILCNALPIDSLEGLRASQAKGICFFNTSFYVGGYVGDEAALDTLLQTLEVVYPLATPIEIDVSELSVDTIVGVNNITSDCGGDVEVEYLKNVDMAKFVETIHNSLSPWFELVATLTAGSTSLVFTNPAITANSTIDPYVDDSFYGVSPTAVVIANGSVTLTFNAQANDIPIKVRIS